MGENKPQARGALFSYLKLNLTSRLPTAIVVVFIVIIIIFHCFICLALKIGIIFLKSKVQEITETGPVALPEHVVHSFLQFVLLSDQFVSERAAILRAFEPYQKSHPALAPLYSKRDDVVNSKRCVP